MIQPIFMIATEERFILLFCIQKTNHLLHLCEEILFLVTEFTLKLLHTNLKRA